MSRFVVLPAASRNLDDVEDYLSREAGPDVARRFLDSAENTFEDLARLPEMGRSWLFESGRLSEVRRWRVKDFPDYLIYYRPLPKRAGVEFLHVRHAARDVPDEDEIEP
jgi:toxin ParE1/3/4